MKKAMTDSLTRICNRHGIEKAIENYRTSLTSSCVVYADIDFFKKINDTYSHEAGDFVLSEIAKIISNNIREDDLVGRMGGEEFLIVLKSTNIEKAKPKLEIIKEAIKKHSFNWEDKKIKVTVSFGVSEFEPSQGNDFERTIDEADKALYHSKQNGRDQITYFNEMSIDNPVKSKGTRR
jgi:diguanylate cyclase (GGDEF)-like protein